MEVLIVSLDVSFVVHRNRIGYCCVEKSNIPIIANRFRGDVFWDLRVGDEHRLALGAVGGDVAFGGGEVVRILWHSQLLLAALVVVFTTLAG
jgi:hypothetical protein